VAFRAKLPKTYTFDFTDAPFPSSPAPGINAVFNSGHYTFWPQPTVALIRGAHKWLTDYIEAHGPYDVVMGFSQGCSLISSFLLYHAQETPTEALPFKAAVFVCGGVPMPVLEDLGLPGVSPRAHEVNDQTGKLLKEKAGKLAELAENLDRIKPGMGLWDDVLSLLHDPTKIPDESDVFGLDFTVMPKEVRIKIPTVHVYGAMDPRWPSSMQLAYFCDDRKMYDHGGGHDIPRSTEVSITIARFFEELNQEI
jgi:pimeloyl-ACP methyl ester carboxylesterase